MKNFCWLSFIAASIYFGLATTFSAIQVGVAAVAFLSIYFIGIFRGWDGGYMAGTVETVNKLDEAGLINSEPPSFVDLQREIAKQGMQ